MTRYGMRRAGRAPDQFDRLHRLFLEHFGIALGLVWAASLMAAALAPWTHNISGLLDPLARPESTGAYLFGLPALMTIAWLGLAFGGEVVRRACMLRNQALEFALAGIVAFTIFCLAVSRAVSAAMLGL